MSPEPRAGAPSTTRVKKRKRSEPVEPVLSPPATAPLVVVAAAAVGQEQPEGPLQPRATSLSFPAKMREIKKVLELDPTLGFPSTIAKGFEMMGVAIPPPGALPVQADKLYALLFAD